MTVEIISRPPPPPRYELTCDSCKVVFQYDREDLSSTTDQRGEPDGKYLNCPGCGRACAHSRFGSDIYAREVPR